MFYEEQNALKTFLRPIFICIYNYIFSKTVVMCTHNAFG